METPPVEPDMIGPWKRNTWVYGLRIPFSLVFLGWITLAEAISPSFNPEIYVYTLLAAFFGLVVGAHYIDIGWSKEKFSPYLRIPSSMLLVGVVAVVVGGLIGAYIALRWALPFLAFVVVESLAAVTYPTERPKAVHSYVGFGLTWGFVPFLAVYYIQAGTVSLLSLGLATFVGLSVVMMHHLAIMSRDSPAWRDALFLLKWYNYSVYIVGAAALLGKLFGL